MSNIGNYVPITVNELDAVLEDYDVLRLYRASSLTGSYSVTTTITLVAGQPAYSYQDATGATTSWYRTSYYNTSTTNESALSEPFPAQNAPVLTRSTLRQRAADRLRLYGRPRRQHTFPGSSGTTTAAGSTTTTVCSTFIGGNWPTTAFTDWFLLATSGTESGNERQITSFAAASGTFTHDAFASGVGSGATFELYALLASGEWNELLDLARDEVWMPFDLAIGGVSEQREYALPYWIEHTRQVTGGSVQRGDDIREHELDVLAPQYLDDQQGGGVVLRATIPVNQVWILSGWRQPPPFIADTGTIVLAEHMQDQWLDATCMRACERLSETMLGSNAGDRDLWWQRALRYRAKLPPHPTWMSGHALRGSRMAVAGGGPREVRSAYY